MTEIILNKSELSNKSELNNVLKGIDINFMELILNENNEDIIITDNTKIIIKISKSIIGKRIRDLRLNLSEFILFVKNTNKRIYKSLECTNEEKKLSVLKECIIQDLVDIIYVSLNPLSEIWKDKKEDDNDEEDELLYNYDKQIKKYEKITILMILFIFGLLGYIIYTKGGF